MLKCNNVPSTLVTNVGFIHDAKIFANSKINHSMAENVLPVSYQTLIPGFSKFFNCGFSIPIDSDVRIYSVFTK